MVKISHLFKPLPGDDLLRARLPAEDNRAICSSLITRYSNRFGKRMREAQLKKKQMNALRLYHAKKHLEPA